MKALYHMVGISKQGHYQQVQRAQRKALIAADVLISAQAIRKVHKRLGCRKIYSLLDIEGMGRDQVEHLLLAHGFRVARKPNYTRTTRSTGYYYENLISGGKITDIDQLYVSDITYIPVSYANYFYLTLVKDVYSRKITGWHLSQTLRTEDTVVPAYRMAVASLSAAQRKQLIFHSDKGSQYIAGIMKELHQNQGTIPSMGGKAWENAHAESLNGILKNEYIDFEGRNLSLKQAQRLVGQVVYKYNTLRPHGSLKNMKPEEYETFLLGLAPKEKPIVTINY